MKSNPRSMKMKQIAKDNDLFRTTMIASPRHKVALTSGVASSTDREAIITAVRAFKTFKASNDPYGEHDFGSVKVNGTEYFFKIDYYDLDFENGVDTNETKDFARVLTIMRADEY